MPTQSVTLHTAGTHLNGDLTLPDDATGLVLFAHGSGSSRHSPRNQAVATHLNDRGFATLLLDLLTPAEDQTDAITRRHRFDIPLLAHRLTGAAHWLTARTTDLPLGLFGASTGAAAALITAAESPELIKAVVSRGGRPDLATDALPDVRAPVLLLVGGHDDTVIKLNEQAAQQLTAPHELHVIPGATHLFPEPGALEEVATAAANWFTHMTHPH
ncbi:dienelactone hydrolase family protein [Streptomyces aculeolatus]|uniref:dienelactone hydrolase family protein n=1 Tax=Streptomyces aculeolatus TaxID=270689 RepID=UPI001CEDD7E0|nr:alpha/beta fold hydrolase [Streptomyces aculeolatus]